MLRLTINLFFCGAELLCVCDRRSDIVGVQREQPVPRRRRWQARRCVPQRRWISQHHRGARRTEEVCDDGRYARTTTDSDRRSAVSSWTFLLLWSLLRHLHKHHHQMNGANTICWNLLGIFSPSVQKMMLQTFHWLMLQRVVCSVECDLCLNCRVVVFCCRNMLQSVEVTESTWRCHIMLSRDIVTCQCHMTLSHDTVMWHCYTVTWYCHVTVCQMTLSPDTVTWHCHMTLSHDIVTWHRHMIL